MALSDGKFMQVSFVNSINTYWGGTHVNHVINKILENIEDKINKKLKEIKSKI